MPSYHIWVRAEDDEKWQAIADKPAWLHEHLSGDESSVINATMNDAVMRRTIELLQETTYTGPEATA